jgi:hypothetical protein
MPWANVFWANLTGGTTATQGGLDAWTTAFYNAYVTNLAPQTNDFVGISQAQATLFQAPQSAIHSVHSDPKTLGSGGTALADTAACWVASWTSGVYWRGGKPRTYFPGLINIDTTDGHTLVAGSKTAKTNVANALHAAINGLAATGITQTQHGFVSFMSKGAERIPHTFFPVTGAQVHSRIGTQRRRLGPWTP